MWEIIMKCTECEHQRVCIYYLNHISKLEQEGIKLTIDNCKGFDEVKWGIYLFVEMWPTMEQKLVLMFFYERCSHQL